MADALDVPVSAGEHEYTRWQSRDLIAQANPDILQPDVVNCGGITEMRKIAVLSDTFPKDFVPHQTQPTIGTAASLHVVASIQTANKPQEFTGVRPELNTIFKEPLEFKDGHITMPTGPGLGLEIDTDRIKRSRCSLEPELENNTGANLTTRPLFNARLSDQSVLVLRRHRQHSRSGNV